jgi:hypothetical protein
MEAEDVIPPPYYGPDYFNVFSKDGTPVAAMFLRDANSEYVMNPLTGSPYIVDRAFDITNFVKGVAELGTWKPGGETANLELMGKLYNAFKPDWPAAPFDMQRTYNGVRHNNIFYTDKNGVERQAGAFVPAFTPAASWAYSYSASRIGVPADTILKYGGYINELSSLLHPFTNIDTSGIYGNNPDNVFSLVSGMGYADGGPAMGHTGWEGVKLGSQTVINGDGTSTLFTQKTWGYDVGTPDETFVQESTNTTTGDKSVTVKIEDYSITFGGGIGSDTYPGSYTGGGDTGGGDTGGGDTGGGGYGGGDTGGWWDWDDGPGDWDDGEADEGYYGHASIAIDPVLELDAQLVSNDDSAFVTTSNDSIQVQSASLSVAAMLFVNDAATTSEMNSLGMLPSDGSESLTRNSLLQIL